MTTMSIDYQIIIESTTGDVDPALVRGIIKTESDFNPWASRFEPKFFERYVKNKINYVPPTRTRETEEIGRATSWGLMQIMGQCAREQGYDGADLPMLCDVKTNLFYGIKLLKRKLKIAGGNMAQALLLWNGGGNKNYPDLVFHNMETKGGTV